MENIINNTKLESTEAKGSYGIGLQIGQQLLDSKMSVDFQGIVKGLFDALHHNQPALDLNTISQALAHLQQQAQIAQTAQFKEIETAGQQYLAENKNKPGVTTTETGLQYEVLTQGTGEIPSRQDKVRVHYTGKLINGTVFDSSVERGQPAEFPVTGVISGWIEALTMMPVGSKWQLTIPHFLAYGERGAGPAIPPFSTLIFEVELLNII